MMRGSKNASLLVAVDTRERAAEGIRFTQPNLGEHRRLTVTHDQIDLTETATIILLNEFEPF